jgi:Putative regulator of cell autolysis
MKSVNFSNKWIAVITHMVIWAIVFSLPYILYLTTTPPPHHEMDSVDKHKFQYVGICTNILWIGVFYFNASVLLPKFTSSKKIVYYLTSVVALFFICIFFHYLIFRAFISGAYFSFIIAVQFNLAPYFLSIAVSSVWQMWSDKEKAEKIYMQKQQETLKTELSFLRSQISPHFFLNVLNNIVALVRLKSDNLEPTIIKLSSLMQYMLYETNEEKVTLKSEINYLQSYIDLQQQRFGKKVKVNTELNLDNDWYEIEPMLLIPFVENAFKHGVGLIENPQIDIRLSTNNSVLIFTVKNKFNLSGDEIKDKTSGIGLANVRRRLNLLYGHNHQLTIAENGNWFCVLLTINLHQ